MYSPADVVLGKYRIDAPIGAGAFAQVYRATHLALRAPRALKVLRRDAPGVGSTRYGEFRERFRLEAELGAALDDLHVIRVHDFEEDGETLILVMEYAAGGSLKDRLAQAGGRLPVEEALSIAGEVAQGLAALHRQEIVHRDLKPSNVLFDAAGRAKVADLGLAQTRANWSNRPSLDSFGPPHPGTPGYKSPEQERSTAYLAPASDSYTLGVVLFEMLTGKLYASQRPGTRASSLRSDVPREVDDLLARLLAEDVKGRPWDGAEAGKLLADVLARVQAARRAAEAAERAAAVEATRGPAVVDAGRGRGAARRTPPWLLLAVLGVALVFGGWGLVQVLRPTPTPVVVERVVTQVVAQEITRAGGTQVSTAPPATFTQAPAHAPNPTNTDAPASIPTTVPIPTDTPAPTSTNAPTRVQAPSIGSTWTSPVDGMVQVYVPAGEFLMGSTDADTESESNEKPQHRVMLAAYWIDRTEVTKDQYAGCVAAGKCAAPDCTGTGKGDHPVVCVSWQNAADYCGWAGRRLPTEAEWEKAARGTDGRKYPWGNQAPAGNLVNYCDTNCNYAWRDKSVDDGVETTSPVGRYPAGASPYGAYDMAGNVSEWIADWYDANWYAGSPSNNPVGRGGGNERVLRGGSWDSGQWSLRAADRGRLAPGTRNIDFGFRCARSQ